MRLSEHPDFRQAIVQAAEHFAERGLRPALIEKDYYVTETLRIIATTIGDKIIFKGGTSLSKGWNLIQRFSEDVDIFLDPRAFAPVLGKNGINRELKALAWASSGDSSAGRSQSCCGMTKDVVFEAGNGTINDRIDEADRTTYAGGPSLKPVIGGRARAATVRVMPRD